eukprot:751026-Hanusia_phi.AAC.4
MKGSSMEVCVSAAPVQWHGRTWPQSRRRPCSPSRARTGGGASKTADRIMFCNILQSCESRC